MPFAGGFAGRSPSMAFRPSPRGPAVSGVVTAADRSARVKGRAHVAFRFTAIDPPGDAERLSMRTDTVSRMAQATKKQDAAKIGGGAAGGAIIGGILGGGDGAAKGQPSAARQDRRRASHARGGNPPGAGHAVSVRLASPLTVRVRVLVAPVRVRCVSSDSIRPRWLPSPFPLECSGADPAPEIPPYPPIGPPDTPPVELPRPTLPIERLGALIEVFLCSGLPTAAPRVPALTLLRDGPARGRRRLVTRLHRQHGADRHGAGAGAHLVFLRAHREPLSGFVIGRGGR